MSRHYFSCEENEAYRDGRRDEERQRHNYERDKYSNNPIDRAYFDGRNDEEREEQRREEEREMERERELHERRECERELRDREQEYLRMEEEMYYQQQREFVDVLPPEYDIPFELQDGEMSPNEYNES